MHPIILLSYFSDILFFVLHVANHCYRKILIYCSTASLFHTIYRLYGFYCELVKDRVDFDRSSQASTMSSNSGGGLGAIFETTTAADRLKSNITFRSTTTNSEQQQQHHTRRLAFDHLLPVAHNSSNKIQRSSGDNN
jgi:hypothetical protein